MIIKIGSTTFEATKCERIRHLTKGFYLDMSIPVENIGMDALRALLDGNKEDIVVTESDGTESIYTGFNAIGDFSFAKNAIHVSQFCESELQAQLSIAQNKVAAQAKTIAEMDGTIKVLTAETLAQAEVVVAQGETIATQNEQVAALMEASASQLEAIDTLMTEVIPAVAQDAANIAVEQALAVIAENATATEETEEVVEETTEEI